jgi:DNA replication protein DnaC
VRGVTLNTRDPFLHTPESIPAEVLEVSDDYKRTAAMLDRLLHRSVVLNIDGDSYRMRSHRARAEATRRAVAGS